MLSFFVGLTVWRWHLQDNKAPRILQLHSFPSINFSSYLNNFSYMEKESCAAEQHHIIQHPWKHHVMNTQQNPHPPTHVSEAKFIVWKSQGRNTKILFKECNPPELKIVFFLFGDGDGDDMIPHNIRLTIWLYFLIMVFFSGVFGLFPILIKVVWWTIIGLVDGWLFWFGKDYIFVLFFESVQ